MATFPRTRNSRSVSPQKRKSRGDSNTLPFQSANVETFQEMGEASPADSSNPISPVAERLAGYVSPLRARTMKEYDQQICDLKKENFHLKLRMYFLEEKMDRKFEGDILDLHKINLQLQVDTEALRKELEQKNSLLEEALGTLEKLENNHKQELHTLKTKVNNERSAMEKKIISLQKQLSSSNVRLGLEETDSDLSQRCSTTDPMTSSDLPMWTNYKSDSRLQNEIQEFKKMLTKQGQELQVTKLQLEELKQNEIHLQSELHSKNIAAQNLTETLHHKEQEIHKLKEQLEMKSGAIETINSAVHTAVYKATMAARKGDKMGITAAREELKTVLRKILLQYNDKYFEGAEAKGRQDLSENLQYLQEELIIKEETVKLHKEELDKVTGKLNMLQTTVQADLAKKAKQHSEVIAEKDSLINRLQASLKDGERRIENLLKEQNEIIMISKKSLQTLQSSLKDRDSTIQELQRTTKKSLEQKNLEIERLQNDVLIKERDLTLAKHNIDALNADINTNKQECESVKWDLDGYRNKLGKLTEEIKTLTENLGIATQELNELRRNKEEELKKLTEELKKAKMELQIKECNSNELKKIIKYKDEEISRIEDDYGRLQDKVEKLENFLLQKEEEVFTSFQIIDEMRRIIQGSMSKEKCQDRADLRWQQDVGQASILKDLKLKLGNLLNQNYSNISTEYSKQLEETVASLLQHVYGAPCKFPQSSDKLENIQCFFNNIQPSESLISTFKKHESWNKPMQSSTCFEDSKLNQLSDQCHVHQFHPCELLEHKISEKSNDDNTSMPTSDEYKHKEISHSGECSNEPRDLITTNQYQVNIDPTVCSYYDNINDANFPFVRNLPRSYSDIALPICDAPLLQRSVESLPAEIEMHCEGWNSILLPSSASSHPQHILASPNSIKIHGDNSTKSSRFWSQNMLLFRHSNDVQELKEEICVLVLKLQQLWEQNNDIIAKENSEIKQQIMETRDLDDLQQQLSESEELIGSLQRRLGEMSVFLKQLLEVKQTTEKSSKHQTKEEILYNDIKENQHSQYVDYIDEKEINKDFLSLITYDTPDMYDDPDIMRASFQPDRYSSSDIYQGDLQNISNFREEAIHSSIQSDSLNHVQYSNTAGSSNRKWWSMSPLHVPHGEWINSEVSKIHEDDKWNGTDQIVVLEASDSDDILLLLNDRGLPKDVFLRNNAQQPWSNHPCWPASTTSPSSPKADSLDAPVVFNKLDDNTTTLNNTQERMEAVYEHKPDDTKIKLSNNPNTGLAHWSSDSDIWSEPDREVSLQRIGVDLNTIHSLSGEPIVPVLETKYSHKCHLGPQTSNRLGSSGESLVATNRTSPSSSSKNYPASKWRQKLEVYLHKLEGLTTTLSLELQHHHDLSEEVITQLTMLPAGEQDVTSSSGLPSVIQDYSHTTSLLWKRIGELVAENKELQDILQKKLSGRGSGRKRTSNSDSSRKNTLRKSKHGTQPQAKSEQESNLSKCQNKLKKLESLLERKSKECERLIRANEILEARNSYSCPLRKHKPADDSLSNTEWDREEVRKLKHEIDKQEKRERRIENLVLEMKADSERKDLLWQDSRKKLNEYKDANERLETMCRDKDHQLESNYSTVRNLQEEISKKCEEIIKLQSLIKELHNDVEQCRKRSVGLEEQNSDQQQELKQAKEKINELETKCIDLQKSLQESNGSKAELLDKNTCLKEQLLVTEQELKQLRIEKQCQIMQSEMGSKTEKDNIQQEISILENEIKSLKSQLNRVSVMQLEQKVHYDARIYSGSKRNSVELNRTPESIVKSISDYSKELGLYQHSHTDWEGDVLLLNLVTEMRNLRTELRSSVKIHRQLNKQIRQSSVENEKDKKEMFIIRDTDNDPSSTLSDISLDRSSTGTLTRSRKNSISGASMESSDSFSFVTPLNLRDKGKTNEKRGSRKPVHSCQNSQTITDFKSELSDSFTKEFVSDEKVSLQNAQKQCKALSMEISKSSNPVVTDDFLHFSSFSQRQTASNKKALKLKLPLSRQDVSQTLQSNSSPQSSCSDNKSWSQGSSVDSPTGRAQFSSPDLGIESDPNHEQCSLSPNVKEVEEWESNFPSCMSVTSTRSAPITVALDYCPQQEGSNAISNLTHGFESNAVIVENDYSLHAVGRLEDYELLKRIMEEALSSLKGITSILKQLLTLTTTNQNKKSKVSDLLKEIDIQCHDIIVWLVKGWHLIGSFQCTSFLQEMEVKNTTLSKENLWLQEELVKARNEITLITKQLSDVTDKLQIAKGEKQLMENTITWHLTKTCRKLQEARSNLIRRDILEHEQLQRY